MDWWEKLGGFLPCIFLLSLYLFCWSFLGLFHVTHGALLIAFLSQGHFLAGAKVGESAELQLELEGPEIPGFFLNAVQGWLGGTGAVSLLVLKVFGGPSR